MENDDGGLAMARVRLCTAGYDLGDARQRGDGTFRIEAWPHGVEFHAAPLTGVGRDGERGDRGPHDEPAVHRGRLSRP